MSASHPLQSELLKLADHPLRSGKEDGNSASGAWPGLAGGLRVLIPPGRRDLCPRLLAARQASPCLLWLCFALSSLRQHSFSSALLNLLPTGGRVPELGTALGGLGLSPGRAEWEKASALCGACPWEMGHSLCLPEPCRRVSWSLFCATAFPPSH